MITVTFRGLRSDKGKLYSSLYNSPEGYPNKLHQLSDYPPRESNMASVPLFMMIFHQALMPLHTIMMKIIMGK